MLSRARVAGLGALAICVLVGSFVVGRLTDDASRDRSSTVLTLEHAVGLPQLTAPRPSVTTKHSSKTDDSVSRVAGGEEPPAASTGSSTAQTRNHEPTPIPVPAQTGPGPSVIDRPPVRESIKTTEE